MLLHLKRVLVSPIRSQFQVKLVSIMSRKFVFSLWLIFGLMGCNEPETIETHKIEKSKSGLSDFDKALAAPAVRSDGGSNDRMVVAIANRPDATWYFKITGPASEVQKTEAQWRSFLQTIRFDEQGVPQWELPDGWSVGGTAPMRFATLVMTQGESPLELRVSRLGPNQDPTSNVNRWRQQLQLPSVTASQIQLATLDNSESDLELFDEQGSLGSSGMNAPFSGQSRSRPLVQKMPDSEASFVVPTGWEKGRSSSIVTTRLLKKEGQQSVQISVTEMPASANRWLPNAQRWAKEVGFEEAPASLAAVTDDFSIDGVAGKRIRLVGPSDQAVKATVGVMVVRNDSAWFFKLMGDGSLVEKSEKEFDEFLKSYRFESQNP